MTDISVLPGITVVIPTINRADVLVDTVQDMLCQDFENYELIVIDQSSEINNKVVDLLNKSLVSTRYYMAEFSGLPLARNFGWQHALRSIVLYVDDDIRCNKEFVRAHFNAHKERDAVMIAGGIEEARGNTNMRGAAGSFIYWTATSIRNFHDRKAGLCLHAPGGNFSVQRKVFEEVAGFDENFAVGAALYEETEFALRMGSYGYKSWFEPNAKLLHLESPTGGCRVPDDWTRYMYGMSHNRSILIFRHLRWWYRPTAVIRLLLYGVSYSRLDWSLGPFWATIRGILSGRRLADRPLFSDNLQAAECTFC